MKTTFSTLRAAWFSLCAAVALLPLRTSRVTLRRSSARARGVTLIEYVLIAAVSLGIIIALGASLSGSVSKLFTNISSNL